MRYHRIVRTIVLCVLGGLCVLVTRPAGQVKDDKPFQSGVEVTSITATVTDKDGHPVLGLTRDAFEVSEDGTRQAITQFTNERVPIGLGLLLDISDSMYGRRIADARTVLAQQHWTAQYRVGPKSTAAEAADVTGTWHVTDVAPLCWHIAVLWVS